MACRFCKEVKYFADGYPECLYICEDSGNECVFTKPDENSCYELYHKGPILLDNIFERLLNGGEYDVM